MKHVKKYKTREQLDSDLKKILSHFIKFLNELGFKNENYLTASNWQTDFSIDGTDIFYISMAMNFQLDVIIVNFDIYKSYSLLESFIEYLKTKIEYTEQYSSMGRENIRFKITGEADNLINSISIPDFEIFMDSKKYNL